MQAAFEGVGGSSLPHEVVIAMFCFHFHTSPQRIRDEWSAYEFRVAMDFLNLKFEKEQDDMEKAKQQNKRR